MDVKTAFLYRKVNIDIYVELPPGFQEQGKVCKLRKALYSLKQAPCIWYKTLTELLRQIGFTPCLYNSAVFRRGSTLILAYVNDLLIAGPDLNLVKEVKHNLSKRYKIKGIGEYKFFLGIGIERKGGKIKLTQTAQIKNIIERFGLSNTNPVATPYILKD